jgi:hypothetical protein
MKALRRFWHYVIDRPLVWSGRASVASLSGGTATRSLI